MSKKQSGSIPSEPKRPNKKDIEEAYKSFPRKAGKALGISRALTQLKTKEDLDDFKRAIQTYSRLCVEEGTEKQYIKHFSTFVGSKTSPIWMDYLDEEETNLAVKKSWDWLDD